MDTTTHPNITEHMWLTNDTSYYGIAIWQTDWNLCGVALGIVECVVGVPLNLFLLVTLLTSKVLRADVRNLLIANLALADLIVDAVCQPLAVVEALEKQWTLGCHLHIVTQLIYACVSLFVSVWIVACLDVLLLIRLARINSPLTSCVTSFLTTSTSVWKERVNRGVKVVVVVAPWVASVAVILPVIFKGLHDKFTSQAWSDTRCGIYLEPEAQKLIVYLFFFLPYGLILLLIIAIAIVGLYVYVARRRAGLGLHSSVSSPPSPLTISTFDASSVASSQTGEASSCSTGPLSAYVTASVLTLVLMGASYAYDLADFDPQNNYLTFAIVQVSLHSLGSLKSTVLPLVWLLMLPDVRARARHVLVLGRKKLRRVQTIPAAFDTTVAYRNLSHD